jgi:hypothetical protein
MGSIDEFGRDSMLHAGWKDWYHLKHREKAALPGTPFENYVESVLLRFHDDFLNPTPAGVLGDGGSDGLADSGSILYACYGSNAKKDTERKLEKKIAGDFSRGLSSWESFTTWRFVTNANVGPECLKQLTTLQTVHGEDSKRPLSIRLWGVEKLWLEVVSSFSADYMNELFPGAPGLANLQLNDLVPLLDALTGEASPLDGGSGISPVPYGKVEFNELPPSNRMELNSGRMFAPRIDSWFAESAQPDLHDTNAARFRAIYEEHKLVTNDPGPLLERIYVAVGGSDFRLDLTRADAVYAVVAYFFDECHIFEEPPVDYVIAGDLLALAN